MTHEQHQLFIESLAESLAELVQQLGGAKAAGLELWPEKTAGEAGKHLLNCLNPDHSQKLSLEQIDFLISRGKQKNAHVVLQYLGKQYGYQITPIEPEDEKAQLQRDYIQAVGVLEELKKRLNKLQVVA